MNIPEKLQELLNYPPLQVIDAITGLPENAAEFDALSQTALITFLAGLYKATRTKEGSFVVESQKTATDLLTSIFVNEDDITATIASYSNQTAATVKKKLDEVAIGFLSIEEYRSSDTGTTIDDKLKTLLTSQRHEILRYLPGNLKIGNLLNDESLQDNTNKMEGPVSSLMHKIENIFSSAD